MSRFEKKIVKAELLWTRMCPLRCHYCAMVTGESNTQTIDFWKRGVDVLKELHCSFIAIYGAEPLYDDIHKLGEFIAYCKSQEISTTVITTALVPNWQSILLQLHTAGLRSLTCSYDITPLDKSSQAKTSRALDALMYFKSIGEYDNVAAVVTVTHTNVKYLYETACSLTDKGIWFFFDVIHFPKGQPGTKTKQCDDELLLTDEDVCELIKQLCLINANRDKLLVHASTSFLELLVNHPQLAVTQDWKCHNSKAFPSWVTINSDGLVYACDDFQEPGTGKLLTSLIDEWDDACEKWHKSINQHCGGCVWNTHIDAHYIKNGIENLNNYVHE